VGIYTYQDSPFPYGIANAKRRLCYFKGLKAAGKDVNVICYSKVFEKTNEDHLPEKGQHIKNSSSICKIKAKIKKFIKPLIQDKLRSLSNSQEAHIIAQRGLDVVVNSFNPIAQRKRFSDFIHELH